MSSAVPQVCGSGAKCGKDQHVYLSLYAYPDVVRQVGDAVSFYFKITNLTNQLIEGPIDFYISDSEEPIASIDSLPASDFFDLLVTDYVSNVDITRRFIVATVWARSRSSG